MWLLNGWVMDGSIQRQRKEKHPKMIIIPIFKKVNLELLFNELMVIILVSGNIYALTGEFHQLLEGYPQLVFFYDCSVHE